MIIINTIILATGSEELNNAIIEYASDKYKFKQVYYREFLLEDENDFNVCIISKVLPGEMEFGELIYLLKNKDIRVILILLDESKEELEICIKYHVCDVLTQPVKASDILSIIDKPKTFKDIEFIYKKIGLDFKFNTDIKPTVEKEIEKVVENKKTVKEIIKYKQTIIGVKNIAVVGLSHGAGATFITLNLAKAIAELSKVAVIENPIIRPKIYNTVGIANYIEETEDFISFAHNIRKNEIEKKEAFQKDNITYIVSDPYKDEITSNDWDENKMLRLLYVSKIPINIVDIGSNLFDTCIIDIIEQFSCILLVIDPYIPNVLDSLQELEKIKRLEKNKGLQIKYIINKYNDGVDDEVINNIDIKPSMYIPFIDPQYVYKAAHKNKIPYSIKEVKEKTKRQFSKIIMEVLPEGINENKRKIDIFKIFKHER